MASKSLLLLSLLIACIALPFAQAQLGLGGIGGIIGGLLNPILGLLKIQGILYCTPTGNLGVNATTTPVFPNALVQLQCGGNVVSSTTTDGSGLFSILLDPVNFLLSTILSGCKLVVNTPLASCNASLPSVGSLVSDLQFVGNTLIGLLNIGNLIPMGFQFNANIH
ncbi:Pollen Ole e 1 allergen and extensin family protein [Perilla frutescens var. hirtella]|uniref:Pollen Ole e 1 allergen and extensin family protein n=1 Tax=Perilla frutescens var. hirtella TaxID=608512 RepID=A0AAD4JDN5_PERFH|nr:Pollen Ole e 1 allergen and extensin family protein [Perilla frutescens var. hirtella]KAH6816662.1 Pollen Ole e 1 allergen and extensin family protein [Perilla frutescens var. frutescens]KAH6831914.1 Pollen Ole e 1 allergen and extensin family protein [Perilla frutescens var. hirtella]